MKRIEPLKLRETDTEERYKINEIIEMLNQRAYIKVLKCNEAVEPKEALVDTPDQSAKYRIALEKIRGLITNPNNGWSAIILLNVIDEALNPTPPDKACPPDCE